MGLGPRAQAIQQQRRRRFSPNMRPTRRAKSSGSQPQLVNRLRPSSRASWVSSEYWPNAKPRAAGSGVRRREHPVDEHLADCRVLSVDEEAQSVAEGLGDHASGAELERQGDRRHRRPQGVSIAHQIAAKVPTT